MIKKAIIVLCCDRDNDLGEKVKIPGPVIGRDANLEAATKLALADPQETDANTMFEAVKLFDELSKEYNVQIATLTGNRSLGFRADKEVSEQLDRVLAQFPAESCLFVSDGEADEELMPIVRSRLKIDSVKIVVMKQAKELEKTYFVLLEKLKDPYYARLIFGVPALIIFMLAISTQLDFGWQPVAMVIGLYLIAKGFGIEDSISRMLTGFEFSVEKLSLIVYLSAVPLFLISAWMGYQAYSGGIELELSGVKMVAYMLQSVLVLLPWAVMLLVLGKIVDLMHENRKFEITKYALYGISTMLLWMILSVASDWVLNMKAPYVSFGDFVLTIIVGVVIAFTSISIMRGIKVDVIAHMKLESKEVLSEGGAYIGKIMGVDRKNASMVIQSQFGQKFSVPLESIETISDKVVVRY